MNCTNKVITIKIPNVYKNYIFIIFTTLLYPVLFRYNLFLINPVPDNAKISKLYTKRYPVNTILYKKLHKPTTSMRWLVLVKL